MKKLLALTLVLLMVAGCSAPSLKLGLGMKVNMTGADASADGDGKSQSDVTACAVTLDSNGKIVGVSWDVAQCKAAVTAAGKVTVADAVQSKKELTQWLQHEARLCHRQGVVRADRCPGGLCCWQDPR